MKDESSIVSTPVENHLDVWDRETANLLRAWNKIPTFWRIVLTCAPRSWARSPVRYFGAFFPSIIDRDFWFLQERIFEFQSFMIRTGHAQWHDVQKYLRQRIF